VHSMSGGGYRGLSGGSREPGLGLSLDNEFASRFDPDG